eukprot:COSAG04_NODE_2726_length_3673_cov_1.904589_4_plen_91_part_00
MTTSRRQTAWLGAATQAWQFYLVLPSFILNLLRHTALTTALTQEADKCGFGQGELRGMIGNLGCDQTAQLSQNEAHSCWMSVMTVPVTYV